jgi:hypothetical protein
LFFEKVFMGACGIYPRYGITVIESDEALVLSEMAKHAQRLSTFASLVRVNLQARAETDVVRGGADQDIEGTGFDAETLGADVVEGELRDG